MLAAGPSRPSEPILPEPVAIVGMQCIFPGARNLSAFWRNITLGVDALREIPSSRWNSKDYDLPVLRGGFVDGLTEFDPLPLGVMPTAVEGGDPEQFLVLSVIYGALLDAEMARSNRGTLATAEPAEQTEIVIGRGGYIGNAAEHLYLRMEVLAQVTELLSSIFPGASPEALDQIRQNLVRALPSPTSETIAQFTPNVACGRVANRLNFMGASYIVDAACASALVAVDQVMRSLRERRCDVGIAAAVHLNQKPSFWLAFHTLNALSRSNKSCPFSADADGLLIGEGLGALVLKRLSDAERDGDRIYALIRGVGVASDGRAMGILTPRLEGEVLAIRRAYEEAGVDPQSVTLVEGHGTATTVGDATEIAALHQAFGKPGYPSIALGSVKSMIGHAMPAAGMAGLIKTALALYHRVLPPTLNVHRAHPDLEGSKFFVNTLTRPWISLSKAPRRAAVNAFGFGGINAHAVLEESTGGWPKESVTPRGSELFLITAESRDDLLHRLDLWSQTLERLEDEQLRDVAFTESRRFSNTEYVRLAIVASSMQDFTAKLARARNHLDSEPEDSWSDDAGIYFSSSPYPGKVAFIFPGLGFPGLVSGYTERLGELALHFPEVARLLDLADELSDPDGLPYPLHYQFFPPPLTDAATRVQIEKDLFWSQRTPLGMMVANLASYDLMRAMGVRPDAMAGFSLGEWSALVAAGVMDLDGFGFMQHRMVWEALEESPEQFAGTWGMVAAPADQVEMVLHHIPGTISVTSDVSPTQTFIGGEILAVKTALQRLREAGIWGQELPFHPVHTSICAPIIDQLKALQWHIRLPTCEVYCGMTGQRYPHDVGEILELIMTSIAHPVRIRDTISQLYKDGVRIFVQLGSGGKLLPNIDSTLALQPHIALSIDLEKRGGLEQFHHLVGRLAVLGVPLTPATLYRNRACAELDPTDAKAARKGSARLLSLTPPRFHLAEEAMNRIRELLVPERPRAAAAAMEAPAKSAVPQKPSVLQEAMVTLEKFLEIQQRQEEADNQLLARYLDMQRSAMTSILGAAAVNGGNAVVEIDRSSGLQPPAFPLLGEVIRLVPGQEIETRLELDLDQHPFLIDHALIPVPDSLKRVEERLPTVAMAVGAEILAEAAAQLVPDLAVVACHDVEATRWISLEDSRTLRTIISARRISDTEVEAEIRTEGNDKPAIRCGVTLGTALAAAPAPMPLRFDRECPHSGADVYLAGRLFHGPRFQVITGLLGMSEDSIAAELLVRDPQEMITKPLEANPIFHPVLLDGLVQVVGYRAQIDDWVAYPVRLGRVELHGETPPPGSTVRTAIRYRKPDARHVEADVDVFDSRGRLWLHGENWQYWRFLWPKELQAFSYQPRDGAVGVMWPTKSSSAVCYRVARALLGDMNPDWLARVYLTSREWAVYRERPRLDWLLGRIAAKDAVRGWLRNHRGLALHPLEVEMANLPGGAPVLVKPAGSSLSISIAHIEDEAIALVAEAKGVGVDLVRVMERGPEFRELAFDRDELRSLDSAEHDALAWLHRAWCAKEAAAKAHQLGFDALPQFKLKRILAGAQDSEAELQFGGKLLRLETALDQGRALAFLVIP